MLITKSKKNHSIGEFLIKPSIIAATELILGKDKAAQISQIPLSKDTVKSRIDELSQDIKYQILEQIKDSPFFAIQCDEAPDISNCSNLLLYARFLNNNIMKEEMLFCHPMESLTTSEDISNVVSNFFEENELS